VVRIKICGVRRKEDIKVLKELKVDYAGFVLYPRSPRFVPPEIRRSLLREAEGILKVAVVVNPTAEEARKILAEGFDLIQLHGDEEFSLAEEIGPERVIKAVRVKGEVPDVDQRWKEAHAILMDTYSPKAYGGTGRSFNWEIARSVVERGFRVILSGGLNSGNVAEAVKVVKPYGVDVSSGVELIRGQKDPLRIREFVETARGVLYN